MDERIWFFISILLCGNSVLASSSCIQGKESTLYIEYGKSLDIPCIINSSQYLNKNFYFIKDNQTLPKDEITMLNSSYISINIKNLPRSKSIYTCNLENEEVCSNTLIVDTKPLPIVDFQCTSYNFQNLTCTWTPPPSFVEITYKLAHYFPSDKQSLNPCPKLISYNNGTKFSCSWTENTIPHYQRIHPQINFDLTMTNIFGTTRIKKILFHYNHVVPNPPVELTYFNKTSESIYLSWSVPQEMQKFPGGLQHGIMYQSEYDEEGWQVGGTVETSSDNHMKPVHFNLTGLEHAYSLYNIRVSIRTLTAKPGASQWSQPSSIAVRTSSKIPEGPPATNIGGFKIVPVLSNSTNVYVYWEPLKAEFKNGDDFKYYIEVEGLSSVNAVETKNTFALFKDLSVTENYTFKIWSLNNVGISEKASTVFVPQLLERIEEPELFTIIPYGNGKYELSWNSPNDSYSFVNNYTIFWCANNWDKSLQQCFGDLYWEYTLTNKTAVNISLSDDTINQFGISANSDTSSSGIVWNTCANIQNKGMGKLQNVWINKVFPTSIEITWRQHCLDNNVRSFTLYYCNVIEKTNDTCKGDYENVLIPIDSITNKANITGLEPNETYFVRAAIASGHYRKTLRTYTYLLTATMGEIPYPPFNLTVTNTTQTSISISWQKPNVINKDTLIFYEIACTNGLYHFSNTTNSEKFTLTNLTSYTEYKIQIRACIVKCSKSSEIIKVRTHGGVPSEISQLQIMFQNKSGMIVVWEQPQHPDGKNLFEVYFRKLEHGHPISYYTEDTCFETDNCNENEKYNKFYISVRAVNFFDGERYEGPWSEEYELQCMAPPNTWLWMILPAFVVLLIILFFLGKRLYQHYKEKLYVDVVLPSGLAAEIDTDPKIWGRPSVDETALTKKLFNNVNLNENLNSHVSEDEDVNFPFRMKKDTSNHQQIQDPSVLPNHVNAIRLHNILDDEQFVKSNNKKCVPGELSDCTSEQGDETHPCLSKNTVEPVDEQPIKHYYKDSIPLQNVQSNQQSQGYVIVGTEKENPPDDKQLVSESNRFTLQNNPPKGYVVVGADPDNKNLPVDIKDAAFDLPKGYVTVGGNFEDAKPPINNIPKGYVAIGEDSSLSSSIQNNKISNQDLENFNGFAKKNCPNGYVTVGADHNSPILNEHEESQLISRKNVDTSSFRDLNAQPAASSSAESSPQRLPDSRGYITLPSKT